MHIQSLASSHLNTFCFSSLTGAKFHTILKREQLSYCLVQVILNMVPQGQASFHAVNTMSTAPLLTGVLLFLLGNLLPFLLLRNDNDQYLRDTTAVTTEEGQESSWPYCES